MALPQSLQNRLSFPAISAPMFLVSGPALVTEVCKNGMIGSFPSVNARPASVFEQWVEQIEADLAAYDAAHPDQPSAPYAVNLIVHKSNPRFPEDLEICIKKKVPLIITSVGHPGEVVKRVHDYGGLVFHDVTTLHHARKAAEAGVDGIILVCAACWRPRGRSKPLRFGAPGPRVLGRHADFGKRNFRWPGGARSAGIGGRSGLHGHALHRHQRGSGGPGV